MNKIEKTAATYKILKKSESRNFSIYILLLIIDDFAGYSV